MSRTEPAWTPHPGPEVTMWPAEPGDVRHGHNGVQWYLGSDRQWRTFVVGPPEPRREPWWQHEREAGA